jgi:hypothetical protein
MPDANETDVTDFSLAVFLSTQPTVRLIRTCAITQSRVAFTFTPATECQRLAGLFISDQALSNPRIILDRARALKTLLHQVKAGMTSNSV